MHLAALLITPLSNRSMHYNAFMHDLGAFGSRTKLDGI
jgi:hypothetical protein